jgi:GH15 family glucan-1,4-alpha-glucosidase
VRDGKDVVTDFTVRAGQRLAFVVSWHPSHAASPPPLDGESALVETERFWRAWSSRCTFRGRYRDEVVRALITLKGLTYAPTGGIVAAPTTSLPEDLGGVRNWDYRFCWLRDATLTLHALLIGGYTEEAAAWRDWLIRAAAGDPAQMQIMYGIRGERRLLELELPWLPGYEGSRPVRIGNAASDQFQLDIYGEVISALYHARQAGLPGRQDTWAPAAVLMRHLADVWQEPDDGIWEVRGGRRHFTHSKVMAWVAVDRTVRMIEEFGVGGAAAREQLPSWRALRARMHEEICRRAYNERVGAFVQAYGSDVLDASVLLMTHCGFLPASDPRMQATLRAVERELMHDGYVRRYATGSGVDGLPGSEGAFLACSLWLADNYAFAGRVDEAEQLFERVRSLKNHLGLLAEEYDPVSRRQLGNFPQGFSHLALIYTADLLESKRRERDDVRVAQ